MYSLARYCMGKAYHLSLSWENKSHDKKYTVSQLAPCFIYPCMHFFITNTSIKHSWKRWTHTFCIHPNSKTSIMHPCHSLKQIRYSIKSTTRANLHCSKSKSYFLFILPITFAHTVSKICINLSQHRTLDRD